VGAAEVEAPKRRTRKAATETTADAGEDAKPKRVRKTTATATKKTSTKKTTTRKVAARKKKT
jgi:hypothetical protein